MCKNALEQSAVEDSIIISTFLKQPRPWKKSSRWPLTDLQALAQPTPAIMRAASLCNPTAHAGTSNICEHAVA